MSLVLAESSTKTETIEAVEDTNNSKPNNSMFQISKSHADLLSLLSNSNIIRLLNAFRDLNDEEINAYVNENIKEWKAKYLEKKKEIAQEMKEEDSDEEEQNIIERKETMYESVSVENNDQIIQISKNSETDDICNIYHQRFANQDEPVKFCWLIYFLFFNTLKI